MTALAIGSCLAAPVEPLPQSLGTRAAPDADDLAFPPVFAVYLPPSVSVDYAFPEQMTLLRELTDEEITTVAAELREVDPSGERAAAFEGRRGSYLLSVLDEDYARVVRGFGADIHPVPVRWDAARFTEPRPVDPESEEDRGGDPDLGVSTEALVMTPPTGVPAESCSSTPAPNTFCPYSTTTSGTHPAINCSQSLVQQLTQAANVTYANGTVIIGGQVRPYFQLVNLGTTAGPAPQIVYGVRIGRQPSAAVPTVRETVVVGGQHALEWETTEMVRRLIFYYAEQYRIGNAAIRSWLDQQAILFVPALTAEGYQFSHDVSRAWRGSRQGTCPTGGPIDTNRNFPFSYASDDVGSCPVCVSTPGYTCTPSFYRGTTSAQVQETNIARAMVAAPGYRALSLINLHARAGHIGLAAGYSIGAIGPASVCTDLRNCTNPDLGLFYRLAGTERSPILRNPDATSIPYPTDQLARVLYPTNGTMDGDMEYGSLPLTSGAATPNLIAMTVELTGRCGSGVNEERNAPATLLQQELDLRNLVNRQLVYMPSLAGGTANAFELPLLQRRNVDPSISAEPMTLRVAVRRDLSGTAITNLAGVVGATVPDDVRSGAYYSEFRWRPTTGWTWPTRSFVCATGQTCPIATLDTAAATVNLCDPGRYVAGSAWTWLGDQLGSTADDCRWDLSQPDVIGTAAELRTGSRDLTHMSQSRLVMSFWRGNVLGSTNGVVRFDVEVSSNNFVGCSFSNYGNCRIVRRVDQLFNQRSTPDARYHTLAADVSDFDGQANVRMRVRVWENAPASCGNGTCDAGETYACTDCTGASTLTPRLRVYDAVFVGWYQ